MMKTIFKKISSFELFSCASAPAKEHNKAKTVKRKDSMKELKKKYSVKHIIGTGGFGVVYAGVRKSDGKPVAIKFTKKKSSGWVEQEDGAVVPREVWCMQRLRDVDGVIRLLDYYERDARSSYILVMERPKNCHDLFDYITKVGRLDESESRDLMQQLVETLLQVHAAGIIHRDVKDENILLDFDSKRIKLLDFGSATPLKENGYEDFDGTLLYSTPEYLLHRRYHAQSATVWSLGLLLYDMVCGDVPFRDLAAIKEAAVDFPNHLSIGVTNLIQRCLSVNPEDRPTVEEILSDPWMRNDVVYETTSSSTGCNNCFLISNSSSSNSVASDTGTEQLADDYNEFDSQLQSISNLDLPRVESFSDLQTVSRSHLPKVKTYIDNLCELAVSA